MHHSLEIISARFTTFLAIGILWSSVQGFSQSLSSSEHPIVVINTGSKEIPDEPKIKASMGIIYNGQGVLNQIDDVHNHYNGNIGIETRGNSTQGFDKKSYSIELWSAAGEDISVPLLGMGAEEDWILHAMVIDKTQLRIPYSFYLWQRMGHYAANWKYVELVIDGEYRGLYLLTEKIKQGKDRVAIEKLDGDDLSGDSVSGGYILRIDWLDDPKGFASNHPSQSGDRMFFQWYYPKANKIEPEQAAYIENWMGTFEEALFANNCHSHNGDRYTDFIDLNSFVDFVLINELSKNADGYKLSSYVHKHSERQGGKLVAGPIWDFDQTYGLSDVCSNDDPTGWTYLQNQEGCEDLESMPMWWQSMLADTLFRNHLIRRWSTFRTSFLHLDSINHWIDANSVFISGAVERNFTKWDDVIGNSIWAEPEPIPESYDEEIVYMKNWIEQRIAWMDANISNISTAQRAVVSIYPNPSTGLFTLKTDAVTYTRVLDVSGRVVQESSSKALDVSAQRQGLYLMEVFINGELFCVQKVLKH